MLLYNMNFRITSYGMTEPSPCVLFFPMYYLVSTQKTKANLQTFQFHNGTCTSTTDVAKYYYIVCNMLNLNFCNCSFPLWKKCFCLNWYIFFLYKTPFPLAEPEHSIWILFLDVQFIHSFSQQIQKVKWLQICIPKFKLQHTWLYIIIMSRTRLLWSSLTFRHYRL